MRSPLCFSGGLSDRRRKQTEKVERPSLIVRNSQQQLLKSVYYAPFPLENHLMAHVSKLAAEKNHRALLDLLNLPGNGEQTPHRRFYGCCSEYPLHHRCLCRLQSQKSKMGILQLGHLHLVRVLTNNPSFCRAHELNPHKSMNCASIHRKIGTHITKV